MMSFLPNNQFPKWTHVDMIELVGDPTNTISMRPGSKTFVLADGRWLMAVGQVLVGILMFVAVTSLHGQSSRLDVEVDRRAALVQGKVVAWRRDIHAHPELSNRETRTADLVAQHLRSLGLEVRTGVAHTGVVGVLRGGRPGPVVALRADMDANGTSTSSVTGNASMSARKATTGRVAGHRGSRRAVRVE